jgi:dTDP-4-dehydrorhamnose reductase
MLKILVTGGNGMLGSELKTHLPKATYLMGRKDLDLSNLNLVDNTLSHDYDIIIHTAAYTNIQYSEEFPENAYNLHAELIPLLQSRCKKLIYISAQGKNHDQVYFKSKLKGEKYVLNRKQDLVVRTNIYGDGGLVKWALSELNKKNNINGYDNVFFNPVSTSQLSKFLSKEALKIEGIINVGTKSILSKYDFLKILSLKNNLDPSLITPKTLLGIEDLTVTLDSQSFICTFIDGILEL